MFKVTLCKVFFLFVYRGVKVVVLIPNEVEPNFNNKIYLKRI
jgi:hypothetical protein